MKVDIGLEKATRVINHGPVLVISSVKDGRVGVTPVAWSMPVDKDPPTIALEIGENHFIFDCIMSVRDFVVNVPSDKDIDMIVSCGSCSGRDVDKVERFGIPTEAGETVSSPRVSGSLAVLECRLLPEDILMEKYNIVLGRVTLAAVEQGFFEDHWVFPEGGPHTLHHMGDRTFSCTSERIIDMRSKI